MLNFFFKQKTAYEIGVRLVGSEMCIRDRYKFLFWPPSKIFQPKFRLTVFVYEEPDFSGFISVDKESPLLNELVNILLI